MSTQEQPAVPSNRLVAIHDLTGPRAPVAHMQDTGVLVMRSRGYECYQYLGQVAISFMHAVSPAIGLLRHHQADQQSLVQVLYEDQQLQYTIFDTHRSELQALDKKINEIRVCPVYSSAEVALQSPFSPCFLLSLPDLLPNLH